ncbi:MAG: twin-arginine translocase subunit TatC [Acidimicrobiales bacterium]
MKVPVPRRNGSAPSGTPTGDMTLVGHLTELRTRLIRCVIAVVVGVVIVYLFNQPIFNVLQDPYCSVLVEKGDECIFLIRSPTESFAVVLSIAGYGGLILAMPVILYQLARFVLPGLYPEERKILVPFVVGSILLLLLGMLAGYLIMPQTLRWLLSFGAETFTAQFSPRDYVSFLVKMLLAFGIAAELPLVLIFLQAVGVVQHATLKSSRRLALVVVMILAAVITPTGDPFTMAVIGIPMYLFYEISLMVGWWLTRRRQAVG